ncbi:hypothetical protein C0Q70_17962 [Pomacea canaliculata]|uniref:Uncharacterized protein n=1 Tax=Pomacea canaliculata TaxID=400727 RepID=A0A2T7NLV7_POMCA|nr:hypothetical protein C0Q70_17962 [Pomacea canaliculata]
MAIRPRMSFAFFGSWICEEETDSLCLPSESSSGRARDSFRFPKMFRNIKEVLELTTDPDFEMDGPMVIDIKRDSKRIEVVPRDGWDKKEEKSDPHIAAGHPPSETVCSLDELKIDEREEDDGGKPDLSCTQELPPPSIVEHEESGKVSDGLSEHSRQNSLSDRPTKRRRAHHDLKTTRLRSFGRSLVAYILILSGITVSAMPSPLPCRTTQNFPKDCLSKLRQQDHCPWDPTVRKKFNDLCCSSLNQTTSYHCQEQPNCIIHACVPERSSPEIIFPQCQKQKTTCTKDGERLLKDGGTTDDHLCDCQPNYRYMGNDIVLCQRGFSLDSLCACEPCAAGQSRDEKNNCVHGGSASTPGNITRHSPVSVTEPTRGDVSVDPKKKEKCPEEQKGMSLTVLEGIAIFCTVALVVLSVASCCCKGPRNMIRLFNGLNL